MRWGPTFASAVALAAALTVAACGGSSSGSSSVSGPLIARTLSPISAGPFQATDFEFGDLVAERRFAARGKRWNMLVGVGASYFFEDPTGVRDGLNISTGDLAVMVGRVPETAVMITGARLDGAKVRAAVIKLGAKPGTVAGRPGLVWGAEGSDHITALNSFGQGPGLGEFDRAVIEPHTVYAARYAADLKRLLGGGHTLGADPVMRATMSCLGDVVAAVGIAGTGQSSDAEVAAGVLRSSAPNAPQEVLCEVPSPANVSKSEQFVRSLFGAHPPTLPHGADLKPNVTSAVVSTGKAGGRAYVRAVVVDKPPISAGYLIDTLNRGSLLP